MKFAHRRHALFLAALIAASTSQAREFTLISYNIENLFDADKVAIYEDYAETGKPDSYSPAKMLRKLQSIGTVLKSFNNGEGPEIACFNELELDFTPASKVTDYGAFLEKYQTTTTEKMLTSELNDEIRGLPAEALLLKYLEDQGMKGYHVAVGQDEPDFAALASTERGVHKKGQKNGIFSKFTISATRSHPTPEARDILEATLDVDGHPLTVLVNHWKSGAGSLESEQSRRFNAKTLRDRLEEVFAKDPAADVILAGDFNSQYNQTQAYPHMGKTGLNDILGSQGEEKVTATATNLSIYNLWHELSEPERRSDHYDGKWGTLMQLMITPGLYDYFGVQYVDNSFKVVALDGVNTMTHLKLPRRWSNAGQGSGASDHFPISMRLRTTEEKDKTKREELLHPGTPAKNGDLLPVYEGLVPSDCPEFSPAIGKSTSEHMGEIFRVTGSIASVRPLVISVHGAEYSLWTSDKESSALQSIRKLSRGSKIDILGILSMHKGRLQFLVEDPSWVLKLPGH